MEPPSLDFVALDWNGTVVPFFEEPPYADAATTIAAWRESGISVVVVSRATQAMIETDVARVGLPVDEIVGCVDKAPVFTELRARYGRGVVLGDHPADLRAASEAGLPFLQARFEGQPVLQGSVGAFERWDAADVLLVTT